MYNSRNISDLRADVAANCKVFLERCSAAGLKVLVTGTVRDKEFQENAFKKGTSKAKVPSFHAMGVGLAFDICQNIKGREYSDTEFFKKCAAIGEAMGFEWGGRWKTIVDMPHFQWSGFKKEFTSKDIIAGRYPPDMPYKGEVKKATAQKVAAKPVAAKKVTTLKHKVLKGETLTSISKKYKVSISHLVKLNGIKNPDKISAGAVLKIYK